MKTHTQSPTKFFQLCVNFLHFWQSWPSLPLLITKLTQSVRRLLKSLFPMALVLRASQMAHVGQVATQAQLLAFRLNSRILFGSLIIAVAPLASVLYVWMPQVVDANWYYQSYYWLFFTLGPDMEKLLIYIGILILSNLLLVKVLLFPGLVYSVTHIIILSSCQTNADLHKIADLPVIFFAACFVFLLYLVRNMLTHRKFHEFDSLVRKIIGLCQLLPQDKLETKYLNQTARELKDFNAKF